MIDDDSLVDDILGLGLPKNNFRDFPTEHQKYLVAALSLYVNPVPISVQKVHPLAKLPSKGSIEENDFIKVDDNYFITNVGYDIFVVPDNEWQPGPNGEYFELVPGLSKTFRTGIKVATPPNYGFLLRERSGLGIKNMGLGAGVIEGTYRGEWRIHIKNQSYTPYMFKAGDKICQAVLTFIIPAKVYEVDELPDTKRGEKGFGSSGR